MKRIIMLLLLIFSQLSLMSLFTGEAQAQQGIVWNTQFFNNSYLSAPAVVTRQDSAVAFNWGSGAPAPGVNADGFTARFSTSLKFPAGTYRFTLVADDGVHLIIDNHNVVIDTWNNPRVGQALTADVTLTADTHNIQVDYREIGGDAYVYLNWGPVSAGTPVIPTPQQPVSPTGNWIGEYYANVNLSGSPTAIVSEAGPSHNWGSGAPLANLPSDNFSARWRGTFTLDGTYNLSIRADDGVRVYVDGVARINEWHGASGQSYITQIVMPRGTHNIVVEYYEAGGLAFLEYGLTRVDNVAPGQTGPSITVTTGVLNVRNLPSLTGAILTRIKRNEVYAIVGRNADSSWWQINAHGTTGWVSARFVVAANTYNVPVTSNTVVVNPPATGFVATTIANVNLRSGFGTRYPILSIVPRNTPLQIVARNADLTWWMVSYNGIVGWVSASYVTLQPNVDLNQIRIVS